MIKVLFCCHGSICRSPFAKYMMIDKLEKRGIADRFLVDAKALSKEEIGNDIHYGSKRMMDKVGIKYGSHHSSEFSKKDYDFYDYIILMDHNNLRRIHNYIDEDYDHKVSLLLGDKEVADPWYTGDFERTYHDLDEGIDLLLERILANE